MAHGPVIFISVAEDSADMHAAALVRAARRRWPQARFLGLTGPRLRSEGVESVFDLTQHAAMLSGVLAVVRQGQAALRAASRSWAATRPDAVVLLDSPTLHLRVARRARAAGLRVLYYIAPQTWASRPGRNRQIAASVDRLACILPFEQGYFRAAGVRADFVGHPLFETLREHHPDAAAVAALRDAAGAAGALREPLIALLPGSRQGVVQAMLPRQLMVIDHLRRRGLAVRAAISAASEARAADIRDIIAQRAASARDDAPSRSNPSRPPPIVVADNASLLTAADLVLVASGTATLHVAYYRKPMIVMYDAGRLLATLHALFGRGFLRCPHLALVNVLAGARIVPEFMPFAPDPEAVARVAQQLLRDDGWRGDMVWALDRLVTPLETGQASERVCALVAELLGSAPPEPPE